MWSENIATLKMPNAKKLSMLSGKCLTEKSKMKITKKINNPQTAHTRKHLMTCIYIAGKTLGTEKRGQCKLKPKRSERQLIMGTLNKTSGRS